jgi:hypothetical protein
MPYALQVIVCEATICRTEIVLHFLTTLGEECSETSVRGDPYLHVDVLGAVMCFGTLDALRPPAL